MHSAQRHIAVVENKILLGEKCECKPDYRISILTMSRSPRFSRKNRWMLCFPRERLRSLTFLVELTLPRSTPYILPRLLDKRPAAACSVVSKRPCRGRQQNNRLSQTRRFS